MSTISQRLRLKASRYRPDLDRIVRRKLGRYVSSNAVVHHSPVRHGF